MPRLHRPYLTCHQSLVLHPPWSWSEFDAEGGTGQMWFNTPLKLLNISPGLSYLSFCKSMGWSISTTQTPISSLQRSTSSSSSSRPPSRPLLPDALGGRPPLDLLLPLYTCFPSCMHGTSVHNDNQFTTLHHTLQKKLQAAAPPAYEHTIMQAPWLQRRINLGSKVQVPYNLIRCGETTSSKYARFNWRCHNSLQS